ncbi:MarR family winged helix-turn-helix transcriptional regulator [Actinokineospora sp. NPDC004072]
MPPPELHQVFRRYMDAVGLNAQAAAAAAGLPTTDWYALSVLDLAGGRLTAGELAERTGLTTGAATRMVDRLARGGHVRRVTDPEDRRRVVVELVPGSLDVDEIVGSAREHLGAVFASFTPEQLAVLVDYFTRATPAFHRATAEIRARKG